MQTSQSCVYSSWNKKTKPICTVLLLVNSATLSQGLLSNFITFIINNLCICDETWNYTICFQSMNSNIFFLFLRNSLITYDQRKEQAECSVN